MSRLSTIPFFLFLFLASCKDKNLRLDKVVKDMADYKTFEYKFVGLTNDSSLQWARYETLLTRSSESDLLQLCESNSPVVRSYAFEGLIEKRSPKIFEVLAKNIQDTGEFDRVIGCMVDPCYVSDYYLERVGYFPYDSSWYKITPEQREFLDSLMLFGSEVTLRQSHYNQIKLRSRGYMLKNLSHRPAYYNRLRQIALAGVIEALPALANFKNPNDVSIIRKVYETEGLIGKNFVFDAIISFPHPALFDIVEKEVTNDLRHDNYFDRSNYKFYKALIQYKTSQSRALLAKTLANQGEENNRRRVESVKYLIIKNSDKVFSGLIN